MDRAARPLWECPRCGNTFVTANMWHSCLRAGEDVTLDGHFAGKPERIRELFDAWRAFVEQFGEVTVVPQKTRICFQTRVRFGGAVIRKSHVLANFWLLRKAAHPLFDGYEFVGPKYHINRFRLVDEKQLRMAGLKELVRESYELGWQREGR